MARLLTVYQLETMDYGQAWRFQRKCVETLWESGSDEGVLVLLEHPPVITIGRSGTEKNILAARPELEAAGVEVVETNRGGDVTYHGPGQIVGYPILPLAFHGKDVHAYLRRLESVLMATLCDYDIAAERRAGYTGVWTPDGKIVSIGVAVSHWITSHGFALNVALKTNHFRLIRPCGLAGVKIVSMADILGRAPDRAEVEQRIIAHFRDEFGFEATRITDRLSADEDKS